MMVELTSADLPRLPNNQKVVVVWGEGQSRCYDCPLCVCGGSGEDRCRSNCLNAEDILEKEHGSPLPDVRSWIERIKA